MKKLLSLVLSFALVCTLISGCGPKGGGGNSSNQPLDAAETTFGLTPLPERTTLTIGFFSGSAHSMPWYIADRMGFFDELNIDVEYESFIGGPAMMEASASWDICDVGAPGILNGMKNYDIFACPSPSEAVSVMTTEEEDRLSLADRPVLAAENDLLETMDFFISIGSYTEEDRTAILDKELVNSSVAERCAETLKTLGYLE